MNPLAFNDTIRYYRAPSADKREKPLLPLTVAETEPSGEGRVASRVECCCRLSTAAGMFHCQIISSPGTVQGSMQ